VPNELGWDSVLARRLQRQRLARREPADEWLDVVRSICGLHAQVESSAELTLWARVDGLRAGFVKQALWEERSLVKTWAMRGTLHLLPADELALYVGAQGLLKPRYEQASWRKAFGMTSEEAVAVLDAIRAALDGPPLTREELGDAVGELLSDARLGDAVRGSWGVMPKLAAFRGDVVFAPPAGQRVRFTRPDRWLGEDWEPAEPKQAMAWMLHRYLAAYGPATREAFARWFGIPSAALAGRLIAALREEVAAATLEGQKHWMLWADAQTAPPAAGRVVALLPAFDQFVVAAPRDDSPVLASEHKGRVYRPQGWLSPVLLVDGRVEGVWSHERKGSRLTVTIEPFAAASDDVRTGAEQQAWRLAEFFGTEEPEIRWER